MAPSRELAAAVVHGGDLYIFGGEQEGEQDPPLSEFLMKFDPSTGRFEGMGMRVEDESDSEEDSLLDSYPMPVTGHPVRPFSVDMIGLLWVSGCDGSAVGGRRGFEIPGVYSDVSSWI